MKDTTLIDFVVPFVDNNDLVWRENYINFCIKCNLRKKVIDLYGARYSGIKWIEYQLKLVKKNMPWINKIYLLLSNIEQAPKDLPNNVIIVLHEQFIPQKYLPTFNSCTIEMFLWNIPNLSENFIYANDDMLPIRPLKPSDFFDNDRIKIEWKEREFFYGTSGFSYQCNNNCVSLSKALNKEFDKNKILMPVHSFTPMIKSHCKDCFNRIKDFILPHIRAFRTEYQHNQYIYPLYEYFKYGTCESTIDFWYTEFDEKCDLNHDIICVNLEKDQELVDNFIKELNKICE